MRYLLETLVILMLTLSQGTVPLFAGEGDVPLPGEPARDSFFTFKIPGKFKNLAALRDGDSVDRLLLAGEEYDLLTTDLKRLRLSPELGVGKHVLFHVDGDTEFVTGNYAGTPLFNSYWGISEYNDFAHTVWVPKDEDFYIWRNKVHRAWTKVEAGDLQVTIGRQLVRFGSGRLWNPLDIFNPISPTFLEGADEQEGVDAVKASYFFGEMSEITAVAQPVRDNDKIDEVEAKESNGALRVKSAVGDVEAAVLGGYMGGTAIGGADCSIIFLDGLLRGALLYSKPDDEKYYLQGNAGYEYTTPFGLYILAEYFYNGNGMNGNDKLLRAYSTAAFTGIENDSVSDRLANQFITMNSHYGGIVLGYDITPLLHGEVFSIYDFQGRGLFVGPVLKYNVYENIDVSAGMMAARIFEGSRKESDFTEFDKDYLYYMSVEMYF